MSLKVINIDENCNEIDEINKKIAVQIHIFYPELLSEMYEQVKKIPFDFDCFISTDSDNKKREIEKIIKKIKVKNNKNIFVDVFENKGRDILPFLKQMQENYKEYDYICHIHSKKSTHSDFGDNWRKYLLYNLFGTESNIKKIFYLLDIMNIGMVFPKIYFPLVENMLIGSNEENINYLCDEIGCPHTFYDLFPAGSMFWAKVDSIKQLFENVYEEKYDLEEGQTDGTFAHAIERFLTILVNFNGFDFVQTKNNTENLECQSLKDINSYDCDSYFYRKEIIKLKNQVNNLIEFRDSELNRLNYEIDSIKKSNSWKITKPLRTIVDLLRRIKIKIKTFNTKSNKQISQTRVAKDYNSYKQYDAYNSKYQGNYDFSRFKTDIKSIAFYLPQFHTFPENDKWWGKGFTEWTNTKKAVPRFKNHYQPRVPNKDIGYYTLDNAETIKKQVKLAKEHGLYGFAFYYYWFSGKRLMEKPVDIILNDKSIDFPFCLCWANENWTRTWDGLNKNILIKQDYKESDYKKFIVDIKKYIIDERYIKIDGKPLIMIYNPNEIPNFGEMVKMWRKYAKDIGIGDLYIISANSAWGDNYNYVDYVDGEFDFAPHGFGHPATVVTGIKNGYIFNYKRLVDDIKQLYVDHFPLKSFYYSCMMGWDNSSRREKDYTTFINYNLESYYKWLRMIIDETRRRNPLDKRIIFINAWNEWAEGTYLEPDEKYGYANINTLSKAIFDLPLNYIDGKKNNDECNTKNIIE